MRRYNKGWMQESERHSLAAQGVKTGKKQHYVERAAKFIVNTPIKSAKVGYHSLEAKGMMSEYKIWQKEHGNFMTPDVISVKQVGNTIIEVSEGRGISGNAMYGVSVIYYKDGKFVSDKTGMSKPFYSESEAMGYAEELSKKNLHSKAFKPTADDKMHEKMFDKDEDSLTRAEKKKLTKKKIEYLVDDEHSASKEYKELGLPSLAHDEARHEHLIKDLQVRKELGILTSHGKKIHTAKFDRCVKDVANKSKGKVNPYAVCESRLGYEESVLPAHRRKEYKIPHRKHKSDNWRTVI